MSHAPAAGNNAVSVSPAASAKPQIVGWVDAQCTHNRGIDIRAAMVQNPDNSKVLKCASKKRGDGCDKCSRVIQSTGIKPENVRAVRLHCKPES